MEGYEKEEIKKYIYRKQSYKFKHFSVFGNFWKKKRVI